MLQLHSIPFTLQQSSNSNLLHYFGLSTNKNHFSTVNSEGYHTITSDKLGFLCSSVIPFDLNGPGKKLYF